LSGRTKKGNKYLRRVLTQAAWAASHCKDGYLRAFFYRVKARRGWGRAIFAVAHKILVIAHSILETGIPYQDLGGSYFDKLHPERVASPCIITRPSPPSGWPEDLHLQAAEHAQHTTKPLARYFAWAPQYRLR
jgi:hypothetical protein